MCKKKVQDWEFREEKNNKFHQKSQTNEQMCIRKLEVTSLICPEGESELANHMHKQVIYTIEKSNNKISYSIYNHQNISTS